MFTENLPCKGNGSKIDWKGSIGLKARFIWNDIEGELPILDILRDDGMTYIITEYGECKNFCIASTHFLHCEIGALLGTCNKQTNRSKTRKGIEEKLKSNNTSVSKNKGTPNLHRRYSGHKILIGVNDLWTTHPLFAKMLKYPEIGYTISYGIPKKQIFICPDCGLERSINPNQLINAGFSCPRCRDGVSIPNKIGFNILEQLNIDFIPEYSPHWIGKMRYDFYFKINDKQYILEMDGGFHYQDNSMSGQTAKKSKEIDDYKDKLALEHDIEIIRIECKKSDLEYIKQNISDSMLFELLDLSSINWLKCQEYICSSSVKIACEIWNKGLKSIPLISNELKISKGATQSYLKQGAKLGWCDYIPKSTVRISYENTTKRIGKKIICIDNNTIYESVKEASVAINKCTSTLYNYLLSASNSSWMLYEDYLKIN